MIVQASRTRNTDGPILKSEVLSGVHRLTLDQYRRMVQQGILTKTDRCELIDGYLIEKPIMNPPHASTSVKLERFFMRLLDEKYSIRADKPVELDNSDSSPQPDLVVAAGPDQLYDENHPQAKDIFLVIEVSDTSLRKDQTTMLELYALDKIPVYWIVNLPEKKVEVYSQPRGGKKPIYKKREEFVPGQSIPIVLNGHAVGELVVSDFLS